jgi:hypothetical protein
LIFKTTAESANLPRTVFLFAPRAVQPCRIITLRENMKLWILTFTPRGKSGAELGRFSSRDEAMIAGEKHFEEAGGDDDGFGWQMSFNGATAVAHSGAYRVRRT